MAKAIKKRASKQEYISTQQLILEGFETPFSQQLTQHNRWVQLSARIPWDEIVLIYETQMRVSGFGAKSINGRVILGALMIKHICDLSDEETLLQIQENMYMQYFIGYSSYSNEAPFDSTLFVAIRKRLGVEELNKINELIVSMSASPKEKKEEQDPPAPSITKQEDMEENKTNAPESTTHKGKLLMDATATPQDIAYPTDLNILNDAREKSEELIDILYNEDLHGKNKPRTYRKKARKTYLRTAQKKQKSKNAIQVAIGKQLRFLKRNIAHLHQLLDAFATFPLSQKQQKYLMVIQEAYRQQKQMFDEKTHSVEHRIVSIHQPHVRPIVRGKEKAKVEFGAKIQVSLVDGFAFLDHLSWEAYNEGTLLKSSVQQYKNRTGYYPKEILADKIYCNRENRRWLKELDIRLVAKPLGRPSAAVKKEHLSPGERNPIEGKFGQAKTAYGMDRIKARLSNTSESWIASIILVLNLVKLAGRVPLALIEKLLDFVLEKIKWTVLTFSADPK